MQITVRERRMTLRGLGPSETFLEVCFPVRIVISILQAGKDCTPRLPYLVPISGGVAVGLVVKDGN